MIETVYLSGPMTGLPEHNVAEFNRVAALLRQAGFSVISPAENIGGDNSRPRSFYMRLDFMQLLAAADAVVVLPGWYKSAGSKAEVILAHELNLPVYRVDGWGDVEMEQEVEILSWTVAWDVPREAEL